MTPPTGQIFRGDDVITVTINGLKYEVPKTFSEITLNDYLRNHVGLTGTKVMCREGGCGVCIVSAAYPDPSGSGQVLQRAVNSCLCPILSCDGWEITTVEGIGNQTAPHVIQSRLTEYYGTQCGYCTSGWIMSMYSLLQNHPQGDLTKQNIEDSCDGNLCRCTGYRPILDAFKSFSKEAQTDHDHVPVVDVEDCRTIPCLKSRNSCGGTCRKNAEGFVPSLPKSVRNLARTWYKPTTLRELYDLVATSGIQSLCMVVGHTARGVYPDAFYDAFADIKGIKELYQVQKKENLLTIGANMPLKDVIDLFISESKKDGFQHLSQLASIISKTAHVALRNVGSWGGNIAMKSWRKEFPSDTFVALVIANARIVIGPNNISYSMEEFLKVSLYRKVILRAELPSFSSNYVFRTYKIMPRYQNAHAYVNAGFRAKIDRKLSGEVVVAEKPAIVFGNITPEFVHASSTEAYLVGKNLGDVAVFQNALKLLRSEVIPTAEPAEASPEYKQSLCCALFYKFALEVVGEVADSRYRSAVGSLLRPLSSGTQTYSTRKEEWPLTQPIPKLESMVQCTGEAKYISDAMEDKMLHVAFVLTTEGNATIYRIDATEALNLPGVRRVFTAADIPGKNNMNASSGPQAPLEEFLATKQSSYAGQPVAIVVADTKDLAEAGASLVKLMYSNVRFPILTCEDAIKQKSFIGEINSVVVGDAAAAISSAPRKISGVLHIGSQVHFHMETMVAVSYPTESGLNIEAGTQWIDNVQDCVSRCLALDKNRIIITVKRNGGGFGAKIWKNVHIATATALAAYLMRRPVKMHMSLWDNSKMIGKRFPYFGRYQVGFDETGKLLGVLCNVYSNSGAFNGVTAVGGWMNFGDNVYTSAAWRFNLYSCRTNLPPNTACRAPGSTEAIYFIEHMMEHVAAALKKPSLEVKRINFMKNGDKILDGSTIMDCSMDKITDQLLASSGYDSRVSLVTEFNQANRWRKRGLNVVPMRFPVTWARRRLNCLIAIFHSGGTVAVTHGGIELGQGINTKVAQVVAYELGIEMEYIAVQPNVSFTDANGTSTGGSVTSEVTCLAAMNCCAQLKERINVVRKAMKNPSWEEAIEECYRQGVDLTARALASFKPVEPTQYNTYGAMCTEVELDVLTGQYQINRVDLLYDCGESMSPLIDIGQVEGAVVMGLGYFTSEEVRYDEKNGQNLTIGTWKYKPPSAKDIPIDFRVELLKNAPNPSGVLRSKVVAEPPLCMTASVVFALRNAIAAYRSEIKKDDWFRIDAPLTVERAKQYCLVDVEQMRYKDDQ